MGSKGISIGISFLAEVFRFAGVVFRFDREVFRFGRKVFRGKIMLFHSPD